MASNPPRGPRRTIRTTGAAGGQGGAPPPPAGPGPGRPAPPGAGVVQRVRTAIGARLRDLTRPDVSVDFNQQADTFGPTRAAQNSTMARIISRGARVGTREYKAAMARVRRMRQRAEEGRPIRGPRATDDARRLRRSAVQRASRQRREAVRLQPMRYEYSGSYWISARRYTRRVSGTLSPDRVGGMLEALGVDVQEVLRHLGNGMAEGYDPGPIGQPIFFTDDDEGVLTLG